MCQGMKDWLAEKWADGHAAGLASGHAAGYAEGKLEAHHEDAIALFQHGMSVEDIAKVFNLGLELVKTWYSEWSQTAVAI